MRISNFINSAHSFLFSIYPILFLLSINLSEVEVLQSVAGIIASLTTTCLLYVCCNFYLKDPIKSGLITTFDLTNPSPDLGWVNEERSSFLKRIPDQSMIFALALIHHLAISNNISLDRLATLFSKFSKCLVIEFVPKKDSQVQKLLSTREDVFPFYDEANFEIEFGKVFELQSKKSVSNSERSLYLFTIKIFKSDQISSLQILLFPRLNYFLNNHLQ